MAAPEALGLLMALMCDDEWRGRLARGRVDPPTFTFGKDYVGRASGGRSRARNANARTAGRGAARHVPLGADTVARMTPSTWLTLRPCCRARSVMHG